MKSVLFQSHLHRSLVQVWVLISSLTVTPGYTSEWGEYLDAPSLMAFADTLFEQKYYYRAMMEYERFSYFYPHHPEQPRARYNIARTMKAAGDYPSALEIFISLSKEYGNNELGVNASFQSAEVLFLMQDYHAALTHYQEFLSHYPKHHLAEEAQRAINRMSTKGHSLTRRAPHR